MHNDDLPGPFAVGNLKAVGEAMVDADELNGPTADEVEINSKVL